METDGDHIMDDQNPISDLARRRLDRRSLIKLGLGGGAIAAFGLTLGEASQKAATVSAEEHIYVGLAATDGWISLPTAAAGVAGVAPRPPFWPDELAPGPFNLYTFGFREVTTLYGDYSKISRLKNQVQHTAPPLYRGKVGKKWRDFHVGDRVIIDLWNLGLAQRPDLADGHTIHWHGFPNQIPYFDGVPETSISVPVGRNFTYEFIPNEAGTYMYHCHFEDVEHVQMGMTGVVFVRPADYRPNNPARKTAYGRNTQTEFDREYTWMITEIDLEEHWLSSHVQQPDWTENRPAVFMINGRTFPDTLIESTDVSTKPLNYSDPGGIERLRYQPVSALVEGNPGEKVLIRIANLGFRSHAIELSGMPMRVVAIDAKPLINGRGPYVSGPAGSPNPNRSGLIYETNSIDVPPGRSYDVILTLPDAPGTYPLASRGITGSGDPLGGGSMRTEVHVHGPSDLLGPQSAPNFR